MALKKTTNRITITDDSVNSSGFRVLTQGVDLSQYEKNPLMLWMHFRAFRGTKDEVLPLGIVSDIKVQNGAVTGQPEFDDSDPFAMTIYQKFEDGIIRMCSAGLSPVEWSEDKALMKVGQTLPTLSKSKLKEVSICDIGRNDNSLSFAEAVLYDDKDSLINLTDPQTLTLYFPSKKLDMKIEQVQIALIATVLGLSLTDNTTEADVIGAVTKLKTDKELAETELINLKAEGKKAAIAKLVDDAFDSKKITAEQKADFTTLAETSFDTAKKILDGMKAYVPIATQLADQKSSDPEVAEMLKLSGEELWKTGKLERLKEKDFGAFKLKYKEFRGEEYTGSN